MKTTMKTIWLVILGFISFNSIGAQEVQHAPTVEQCRANQKLWLSKLEQEPSRSGIANIGYRELDRTWGQQMLSA